MMKFKKDKIQIFTTQHTAQRKIKMKEKKLRKANFWTKLKDEKSDVYLQSKVSVLFIFF